MLHTQRNAMNAIRAQRTRARRLRNVAAFAGDGLAMLATLALIAALAIGAIGIAPAKAGEALPPCASEASDNCVWNASAMGNGQGDSFVSYNGVTYTVFALVYVDAQGAASVVDYGLSFDDCGIAATRNVGRYECQAMR